MPSLIDQMVDKFYELDVDYLSNTLEPSFPDGLDVEIMKSDVLNTLEGLSLQEMELEHVTYGVYSRPHLFKLFNYSNHSDQSLERWTVDYEEDLDFIREVFKGFLGSENKFSYQDVCEYLRSRPELKSQIDGTRRNESLHNYKDNA
jgi:spore coat polysaccharide biosynthesis protein SpsF